MTTDTLTLTEFLLARIAEDEAHLPDGFDCWYRPERYEAECEAKRHIVESLSFAPPPSGSEWARVTKCNVLALLAAVYSDHPDFNEAWREGRA